jgi:aminopeptidase N
VATYLEALYAESLRGESGYRAVTSHFRQRMRGGQAIARSEPTSAQDIYGTDIYYKGALVLHALRGVIGKEALIDVLQSFVAGTADAENPTCRSVTTAEFVQTAEEVSGRQLDGFFSVYLYQEQLPAVAMNRSGNTVTLEWVQTGGAPFEVPVPVEVDGEMRRVEMDGGLGHLDVASGVEVKIDPNREVLMNANARSTP